MHSSGSFLGAGTAPAFRLFLRREELRPCRVSGFLGRAACLPTLLSPDAGGTATLPLAIWLTETTSSSCAGERGAHFRKEPGGRRIGLSFWVIGRWQSLPRAPCVPLIVTQGCLVWRELFFIVVSGSEGIGYLIFLFPAKVGKPLFPGPLGECGAGLGFGLCGHSLCRPPPACSSSLLSSPEPRGQ